MRLFGAALCGLAVFMTVIAGAEIKETLRMNAQVVSRIPTNQKVVALTFDDGPNYKTTSEILATLKEKKVKATFFVVGENVERLPNLLSQEVKDGHEIGIHTYDHKSLPKLSTEKIEEEIEKAEKTVIPAAAKPTLFRPPGGLYNKTVIKIAKNLGYTVILWSIDPRDWRRPPVAKVVDNVVSNVKPGSIILLHDGRYPSPTPEAIGLIIDRLKEQGYALVTVGELLQYNETRSSYKF